jgi:hypothetical protein
MIDDVGKDLKPWIDVTFTPEGLEFAEMLWDPTMHGAVIARPMKSPTVRVEESDRGMCELIRRSS